MGVKAAWCLVVGALLLSGCAALWRRQEMTQAQAARREDESFVIGPIQLATPLGPISAAPIQVDRHLVAQQQQRESLVSSSDSPAITAAARAVASMSEASANPGAGGGLLAYLLAALATGGGLFAWLRRRAMERSVSEIVGGIEAAKQRLPEAERRVLLDELDCRLSQKSKVMVRNARAKGALP